MNNIDPSDQKHPPEWPLKWLRFFLKESYLEEIEGDLEEIFQEDLERSSYQKARRLYTWEVLKLFRPGLVKNWKITPHFNQLDMYKNYLKIAWRNLQKFKMYSAIKIGGFAIGIAAVILITLFVLHETDYDRHYTNTDRIFRVINNFSDPEEQERWPALEPQMASVLQNEFPEVEKAGRLIPYDWYNAGSNQFRPSERVQNNHEEGFVYMDQSLLEILEIPLIYGERTTALAEPKTIVIAQRIADKYYPYENPVGKTVILNEQEEQPYTIGGVMENFPATSHLQQYDFLLTLTDEEFWEGEQTSWCCSNYNTYALLRPDVNPKALEPKMLSIRDNYLIRHFAEQGDKWADRAKKYLSYDLDPISDIHLNSAEVRDVFAKGDIRIVRLFGAIGIFILLLACINFINLSTAKSANRAKETGLRKVVGSHRSHLIQQFLTESILFSGISVVLGTLLAWALLPAFNELSGKALSFPWQEWAFFPILFSLALIIGLLAGIYPSFYLSAFKPIDVLKGKLSRGSKASGGLRSTMVVFQFATSMVLITSAFVVYYQMQYILHKDLGFDKEQVVMIQGTNTLGEKLEAFKNELLRLPEVNSASTSNYFPVSGTKRDQNPFWIEGRKKLDQAVGAQVWRTDEDYLATLDMQLKAGRNFSPDIASDTAAIIINQIMADELGLKDPLHARIENNGDKWTVIGVVENFHFESMKGEIGSLAFVMGKGGSIMATEVSANNNMEATLAAITGIWDEFMPNQPIRYTFLDETFAQMYAEVQRTGNVFAACAGLAIIIACLGLFGLATFMAEQRSKEISIRKVLGASMSSLYQLLTANFLKLILISLLIGTPVAWYLMRNWLQDYEYRLQMHWWFFALAGLIIIGIALFTVSRQALKLAFSNPVEHLRRDG
jgi:putative ABC transport system permease protein